jgi:hypothetical protein
MSFLLLADLNDPFRSHGFVASTTFGIQELEQFLESAGICGIAEKGTLSLNMDEVFGFELIEMMRQRGIRNIKLLLDLTDYKSFRMGGEQQLHDPQARLRTHGGEHVRIPGHLLGVFRSSSSHVSIIAEIWIHVKWFVKTD